MKNLTCLFLLMFVVILMTTSCNKSDDDPTPPTADITTSDLAGTWNFTSLETFNETGTVLIRKYENSSYDIQALINDNVHYGALKLVFTSTGTIKIHDLCSNNPAGYADGTFTVSQNQITCKSTGQFGIIVFKLKELN